MPVIGNNCFGYKGGGHFHLNCQEVRKKDQVRSYLLLPQTGTSLCCAIIGSALLEIIWLSRSTKWPNEYIHLLFLIGPITLYIELWLSVI